MPTPDEAQSWSFVTIKVTLHDNSSAPEPSYCSLLKGRGWKERQLLQLSCRYPVT